jgi:hypothetical protein
MNGQKQSLKSMCHPKATKLNCDEGVTLFSTTSLLHRENGRQVNPLILATTSLHQPGSVQELNAHNTNVACFIFRIFRNC